MRYLPDPRNDIRIPVFRLPRYVRTNVIIRGQTGNIYFGIRDALSHSEQSFQLFRVLNTYQVAPNLFDYETQMLNRKEAEEYIRQLET